jgi:MFS family permease
VAQALVSAPEHERPIGFLGLMRNRNYALLWWGQFVSEMGNRFHWVAISLWVYSSTRSASAVSLAIASMFIGNLLVSLWAGVFVDWFNRKRILILSDIARAILVALIPTLMGIDLWLVYADLALISVGAAFFRPAMLAVVPTIVNRRDFLPANSFFAAMDTSTEVFGPALAGFLALRYGYSPLLYLDAATYAFSALCLLGIRIPRRERIEGAVVSWRPVFAGISEGLRFIRRDALQRGLFTLIFPAYLVGSGLNALQTPLAKGVVGVNDTEFGTFNSVWGVGFLVASLVLGWFGVNTRKSYLILGGFFLQFAATGAMALSRDFDMLLVTAFGVGFANTLNSVSLTTVLMEHTPQEVLGRVISTRQVAFGTIRILSPLVFGALGDAIGIRQAMLAMVSAGAIGTSLVAVMSPALRHFDRVEPSDTRGRIPVLVSILRSTKPEFDGAQQIRLNYATISAVAIAWLGLAYHAWYGALGALLAILGVAYIGSLIRRGLAATWAGRKARTFVQTIHATGESVPPQS